MSLFYNRVKFNSSTSGAGSFTVGTAPTGFRTPATAGVADATVVTYTAQSADFTQWEVGRGAYTASGTTIARTTVYDNSSGTTSAITFSNAPLVWLDFVAQDIANPITQAASLFDHASLGGL